MFSLGGWKELLQISTGDEIEADEDDEIIDDDDDDGDIENTGETKFST